MALLEVEGLKFKYESQELFNEVSFRILEHDHIVLVGDNGAGKSTFMNLICHNLSPDKGKITWLNNVTYAYLDQHLMVRDDISIKEYIYGVFKPLFDKEELMNSYYEKLATCQEYEYDKYLSYAQQIQEELEKKNFYAIDSLAGNMINGLGIAQYGLDTHLGKLSSGQRAKVYLAKLLLDTPDVLLMDEPTNFLDSEHVSWLADYLKNYKKQFVVISHDEEFLRKIGEVVVNLSNKQLTRYNMDYDRYLVEKEIREENYQKSYEKQQEYIKRTQNFIDKNIVRATTSKQAKSRRKALERLQLLEKPKNHEPMHLTFPFSKGLGQEVLKLKDLSVGYQDKVVLSNLDLLIKQNQKVVILGRNGVGKSTILKGILNVYSRLINTSLSDEDINYRIALASPTGRAAKRMTEVTCFKAQTIHKLLGYKGDNSFQKNKEEKMPYKLIIIDEVSMLDVNLAKALFEAIKDETQVILIGDYNQLPSVGPGNVLHDLMNSSYFKVTKLNQIMRQSQDSNIIKLSSMVLAESIDYRIFSTHKDVFFYNYSTKDCLDGIKKMLDAYIQSGGDIISNMQILAPMYKGPCGIDAINQMVQSNYNKEKDHILVRGNKIFKKNDKVLQLKNDTELEIMNGDIGRVIDVLKVDDKDVLYVDFDGKLINYPLKNLDDLTLAYAISIHKSQGSEFENVIMPVLTSYQIMLKKRIIYTGITRAKKKLIILGDKNALSYSLLKGDYERQTSLLELLNNENNIKSKQEKIYDPNIPFDTFGEYDMEGITPYTFMDK